MIDAKPKEAPPPSPLVLQRAAEGQRRAEAAIMRTAIARSRPSSK
jgi:hypothetical protein